MYVSSCMCTDISAFLSFSLSAKYCPTHFLHRHIEVRAEIQSPQVCLESCQLHVERAFVGVEEKKTVRLRNNGLIPSQFAWSSQVHGWWDFFFVSTINLR